MVLTLTPCDQHSFYYSIEPCTCGIISEVSLNQGIENLKKENDVLKTTQSVLPSNCNSEKYEYAFQESPLMV